jgi:hypothetical protein
MNRLAYRNFGDHESLVANHSVTVSSGNGNGKGSSTTVGLRWYELRNPNGTPVVYQQATFAPDSTYRWMGGICVARTEGSPGLQIGGVCAGRETSCGAAGTSRGKPRPPAGSDDVRGDSASSIARPTTGNNQLIRHDRATIRIAAAPGLRLAVYCIPDRARSTRRRPTSLHRRQVAAADHAALRADF